MRRRHCLAAALAAPLARAARAQAAPARRFRLGLVLAGHSEAYFRALPLSGQLVEGLREQGLVEGRDYQFEFRFTAGRVELFEPLMREHVAAGVDMLLPSVCGLPLDAARRASRTIPIVVPVCNDDLVELGIVHSLHHPGGNITGLTKLTPELAPKRLQLLRLAIPALRRLAVLWNPAYAAFTADWRELRAAAAPLGVELLPVEFRRPEDIEPAFDAAARLRPDGVMTFSDLLTYVRAHDVAQLARAHRLAAIFAFREVADAGGLMAYGPSIPAMYHQSARLIARILRGEKPGDLPIEQASRFELVVNRRAARELGLALPRELLVRANEVIE